MSEQQTPEQEETKIGGTAARIWHTISPFVYAVVIALLVRTFVIEPWQVPTGSMLDTIQLNDMIWAEKLSYRMRGPEQGEIVVFESPYDEGVTLVKRVIATAGQTVDLVDGKVVVDGKTLDEPYTQGKESWPLEQQAPNIDAIAYPYTVPEGCIWVMGDNRTNSRDSRYYGPVKVSEVKGHAVLVSWPLSDFRTL